MNYEFVKTFVTLAQTQNITKAANRLYVTQSTISYRLKSLEAELGVTLFRRDKGFKQIDLTDHGQAFAKLALEWLQVNDKLKEFNKAPIFHSLSIGLVSSVNNYLFSDFYKNLQSDEYDWRLDLKTLHTYEVYEQINLRTIDLGFVLSGLQSQSVKVTELLKEHLFVVSKGTLGLSGKIAPSELDEENQIYIDWGESYRIWHNKHFKNNTIYKFKVDSAILAYKLLDDTSWFFAPFSVCMAMRDLYDYQLSPLLGDEPARKIYMISSPLEWTLNQNSIMLFKSKLTEYIEHYNNLQQTLIQELE